MISPEKRWREQRCKKLPRTHGHRGCTNRSTGGQSRRQSPRPQRRHCRHRRRQPRRRICRRPPPPPAGGGGCKSGGSIRADAAACRSRLSAFVCRIEFSEDPVILQCFSISLPKLSLATPSHSPPGPFSLFESLTALLVTVPRATGTRRPLSDSVKVAASLPVPEGLSRPGPSAKAAVRRVLPSPSPPAAATRPGSEPARDSDSPGRRRGRRGPAGPGPAGCRQTPSHAGVGTFTARLGLGLRVVLSLSGCGGGGGRDGRAQGARPGPGRPPGAGRAGSPGPGLRPPPCQ
jgi:hypothetical protein